jgi:ABC-type dipeptide/oligopeptide/nickel transport system permease subunit
MGCLSEPRYHLTTPFPHQAKEDHVSGRWMSFFPGAALILMTAGFILIGDGINARSER